ncbi:MAG: hypothetical protein JWR12_2072 [Mucilaginibacter sp.]|nr:hypothetical protein [Mucilaginibacter sp.]
MVCIFMAYSIKMSENKEEKKNPASIKHMAHEALHDLIHFDSKFFRTLPPLLFKPGYLAEQSFTIKQNEYVKPFALFVFLNFVFFIFKSHGIFSYSLHSYTDTAWARAITLHQQAEQHLSINILTERFNMAMRFEQKEYLVIMVPLFALILQLLYIFKKRNYAEHLVFALYFYSFFIIYLMVMPYVIILFAVLMQKFNVGLDILYSQDALVCLILIVCFIYLFFAVRKVYKEKWVWNILKSVILSCSVYCLIAFIYRYALFFIVMHSIAE